MASAFKGKGGGEGDREIEGEGDEAEDDFEEVREGSKPANKVTPVKVKAATPATVAPSQNAGITREHRTALISATLPARVEALAAFALHDPVRVLVEGTGAVSGRR